MEKTRTIQIQKRARLGLGLTILPQIDRQLLLDRRSVLFQLQTIDEPAEILLD